MSASFTERLCAAIAGYKADDNDRRMAGRAIADTIGVAAAGFPELVTEKTQHVFAGSGVKDWSGSGCDGAQGAALVNAIAAHALDFDDLFVGASVHPSSVLLPAILSDNWTIEADTLVDSYCAGLLTARAVSRRVGRGNRRKGWHGTSVFGALGAAAAMGRRLGLAPPQLASALALAAAQAGGMQINFGTMAKPSHAGFAAAAGYRAARMAEAGIDGSPDVFGPKGFTDLYGDGTPSAFPDVEPLSAHPDLLALKLFPCCYGAHRMIGLALTARGAIGAPRIRDEDLDFDIVVPEGSMKALRYVHPATGLEAKFSGHHTVAIALLDGAPKMTHFTDEDARRSDLAHIRHRVTITQSGGDPAHAELTSGSVSLTVRKGSEVVGRFERSSLPGSPDDPPSSEAVRYKIADCLGVFERRFGRPLPILPRLTSIPEVAEWLPD